MSLSNRILFGLCLGIATGLFFGEDVGFLAVGGEVFVRLLQMTVLPYVLVSLMAGLGRLSQLEARALALRGGVFLLLIWALSFTVVAAIPLTFPDVPSGSFFSTTLVQPRAAIDFVGLYVPSNPFHALANNIVPAVVLFSIAMGVALIGTPRKEALLETLKNATDALTRLSALIVRLTPYGIFALAASAAGTMTVSDFARVQVYLETYITAALVMTYWVLPGLVASFTPFRRGDVTRVSRDALITAFATGSHFVVLPLLAENAKQLVKEAGADDPDQDALVDIALPVSYNFPHAAKVLTLSFVVFAGWASGSELAWPDYGTLAVAGIASMFGSVNGAVPFLLDLFRIPEDFFQLFVATSVVNARFGTLLATMSTFSLSLLVATALAGMLRFHWKRFVSYVVLTVIALPFVILGIRLSLTHTLEIEGAQITDMSLTGVEAPNRVVGEWGPLPPEPATGDRLGQIRQRGVLRVGFLPDALPVSYFNARHELVGFNIELSHRLAQALGVSIEFVPVRPSWELPNWSDQLNSGYCDIYVTFTPISLHQARDVDYSRPYIDASVGFLVRDYRRREFSDGDALRQRPLRVTVPADPYYSKVARRLLPAAELLPGQSLRSYFDSGWKDVDALLYIAELGSAWTLLYPGFAVVVPDPPLQTLPIAFPLPRDQDRLRSFVDDWIEVSRRDGSIDGLYRHWILGRDVEQRGRRWSIAHDVLGWLN